MSLLIKRFKRLSRKFQVLFSELRLLLGFQVKRRRLPTSSEGIKKNRFNHLGVFKYSDEEGTPAVKLEPKVPQEVIDERFEIIYEAQKEIARELNQEYIGKIIDVLVEGPHEETELLLEGRHAGQAPDIDGKVIINDGVAKAGDIVKVEITEVLDYDLLGRIVSVN
jgi:ribosomal protein S12 methylthiotransferase